MKPHVLASMFMLVAFSFGWMAAAFFALRHDLKKAAPSPFALAMKDAKEKTPWLPLVLIVFGLMCMATGALMGFWILSTYRSGPIMLLMAGLPIGGVITGMSLAFLGENK